MNCALTDEESISSEAGTTTASSRGVCISVKIVSLSVTPLVELFSGTPAGGGNKLNKIN